MRRSALLAALVILAMTGGASRSDEPAWRDQIDEIGKHIVDSGAAVGISIAIGIDGTIVYERAFGFANLEHRVPLRTDSLMRAGSITKQFTAAAILTLVDSGKLSLDTTLAEALPDWPIPIDPMSGEAITIEQMLTHTSGLRNMSSLGRFDIEYAAKPMSLNELAELIGDEPFTHKPGTEWRYCNTAYWLLGKIVERYSGTTLEAFFRETLLDPAGLETSRFDRNKTVIPGRAQGYDITPEGVFQDDPLEMMNVDGGGALLSTPRELIQWTMALSSGRVLPIQTYTTMSSALVQTGRDNWSYGYGLLVDTSGSRKQVFHTGGINGFNSKLSHHLPAEVDPRNIVIAVICNGTNPESRMATRNASIAEALIAQAVMAEAE